MTDVRGKHAFITGGGSGVGAAIALDLAAQGALVSIVGRRVAPLKAVAKDSKNISYYTCDVTDYDAMQACAGLAVADSGPLSIAIANAGAADSVPFSKMTAQEWTSSVDINLTGVFNCYKACLPHMLEAGWGRLIAIASTAGLKGYPYVANYCAAKHGVIGLTKALALEYAKTGVTANAICPGFTQTPMLERSIENIQAKTGMDRAAAVKALTKSNPMGRFIQPAEIVATVHWLIGEQSGSISGQAISVSGGEI